MGGGDINMPAPQQVNYGESMREALEAQIDLAPDLYAAEADPNFGRKAYARLSQDIAMDSLLGEAVNYDSEGRILEGYEGGQGSRYTIVNNPTLTSTRGSITYGGKSPAGRSSWSKTTPSSVEKLTNNFQIIDRETGELVDTGDTQFDDIDNALSYVKDDLGGGELQPVYRKDKTGNIIQDASKAGQTTRMGGGLVDIYGGTEEFEFEDADGNISKRRAGFDENGNFQGLSKLADELQTKSNDSRVAGELQLVKEYGDDFTKAYRDQGDIQGALDKVEKLTNQSSIPTDKLDAQGDRLSNLAASFGQGQQIGSVYNNERDVSNNPVVQPTQKGSQRNPQAGDLAPRPQEGRKGSQQNPQGGDLTGQGKGQAEQKPQAQRIAEEAQSRGRRLGYRPNANAEAQQQAQPEAGGKGSRANPQAGDLTGNGKGGQVAPPQAAEGQPEAGEKGSRANPQAGDLTGQGKAGSVTAAQAQGQAAQAGGKGSRANPQAGDLSGQGSPYAQESMNQTGVVERDIAQRMREGTAMTEREVAAQQAAMGGGTIMARGGDQGMRGGMMSSADMFSQDMAQIMPAQQQAQQAQMMPALQPSMLTDQKGVGVAQAGMGGRDVNAMEVGNLSGLRSGLNKQAASELAAGGDLTDREVRAAQQQARAASTARGRTRDTAGVLSELRNNEMFANQRLRERQAFAQGVAGQEAQLRGMDINSSMQAQMSNQAADLNLGARQGAASAQNQQSQLALTQMDQAAQVANQANELARQQMLLGATEKDIDRGIQVDQINTGNEMQGLQMDRAAAAQRVGLEQATSADPLAAVTGRPSGAGVVGAGNLYGNAAGAGQVPMMYNPAQGAEFIANQAAGLNSYNAAMAGAQAQVSAGKSNMYGQILGSTIGLFKPE